MHQPLLESTWPPAFSLDQGNILHLLTGDRFYSDRSAALREAILNSIDAISRRHVAEPSVLPRIELTFDRRDLSVTIDDNGTGMDRGQIAALFTRVGASAATMESGATSVGEFGIGVISYFLVADSFELQTFGSEGIALGLLFTKDMLSGGSARSVDLPPSRHERGTTVVLRVRDGGLFELLLRKYSHWCRDVDGLTARVLPEESQLAQGGVPVVASTIRAPVRPWIERARIGPVADPAGWQSMTGASVISVLYRGVFVTQLETEGLWGIRGSIDVSPKHFKPRLNREGFVSGDFEAETRDLLEEAHPAVLDSMADHFRETLEQGQVSFWDQKRWASLWLLIPRTEKYLPAVAKWDKILRSVPAFELAVGNRWEPASLDHIVQLRRPIYVAPLVESNRPEDLTKPTLYYLRNTGATVIRGIQREASWMRPVASSFATTADLITKTFRSELSDLVLVQQAATTILDAIEPVGTLYIESPRVDLVRLGPGAPAALRVGKRLIINVDNTSGRALANGALDANKGSHALVELALKHAYEQLTQIAAAVRRTSAAPEVLSPLRRQHLRKLLQ